MIFISASDIWASDFCKSLWVLKVRKLSDAIPEAEIPHRPVWKNTLTARLCALTVRFTLSSHEAAYK